MKSSSEAALFLKKIRKCLTFDESSTLFMSKSEIL